MQSQHVLNCFPVHSQIKKTNLTIGKTNYQQSVKPPLATVKLCMCNVKGFGVSDEPTEIYHPTLSVAFKHLLIFAHCCGLTDYCFGSGSPLSSALF